MNKHRRIINVSAFVLSVLSILTPLIVVMSMLVKDYVEFSNDATDDRRKFLGLFLVFYLIIWIEWAIPMTLVWSNLRRVLSLLYEKPKLYQIIFSSILFLIALVILLYVVRFSSTIYSIPGFIVLLLIYAVIRFVFFMVDDTI